MPKIVWKFQTYEQFCIHRVADFVETIFDSWTRRKPAISFILQRAILEHAAVLYDTAEKLGKLISEKNFSEIDQLALRTIFSNRIDKDSPFQSTNIMTVIDRVTKTITHTRKVYDIYSEYVHPNRDALLSLYGEIQPDEITCKIRSDLRFEESTISIAFTGLFANLDLFTLAVNNLNSLYGPLAELAPDK
jgi:hypothetical protein